MEKRTPLLSLKEDTHIIDQIIEENRKHKKSEEKEPQDKMIRTLQGIFCKGRYRNYKVIPKNEKVLKDTQKSK